MTGEAVVLKIIGGLIKAGGSSIVRAMQAKRLARAQAIIQARMKRGKVWAFTEDQAAAALFTYLRAAEEGAAVQNLDFMAQCIASAGQDRSLTSHELRRYLKVLADLSREEIMVLARMIVAWDRLRDETDIAPKIRKSLHDELAGPGKFFASEQELDQHLSALQRTGLVVPLSAFNATVFGPAPSLDRLKAFVDFTDLVSEDVSDGDG